MLGTRPLGKVGPGKELGTEVGTGEDWGLAGGGWFGRSWVRKRLLEFLGERKEASDEIDSGMWRGRVSERIVGVPEGDSIICKSGHIVTFFS